MKTVEIPFPRGERRVYWRGHSAWLRMDGVKDRCIARVDEDGWLTKTIDADLHVYRKKRGICFAQELLAVVDRMEPAPRGCAVTFLVSGHTLVCHWPVVRRYASQWRYRIAHMEQQVCIPLDAWDDLDEMRQLGLFEEEDESDEWD